VTETAPTALEKLGAPSSDEFTKTLGQVVWLLGLSSKHRIKEISTIEASYIAPLMLQQLRIFSEGKQPLAALTWAYASPEVRKRIEAGETPNLQDWRSGSELVVVDCISPFTDGEDVKMRFLAEVEKIRTTNEMKSEQTR